jgi:hypothetical protein
MGKQPYNEPFYMLHVLDLEHRRIYQNFEPLVIIPHCLSRFLPHFCVILLIYIMHGDSNLGFWNSLSRYLLIYVRDLIYPTGTMALYFIYHARALSLNVVSSCAIFNASSMILFTYHIVSHVNQCYSSSYIPIPWNAGKLKVLS